MADSIDILVKLFDTLKTSTDKNESSTQQLVGQQQELVTYIKSLPIKDLRDALAVHAKDSDTNIDSCSDTIKSNSEALMAELKKISVKISKMTLVAVVIFTVLSGAYLVVRSVADNNSQFEQWQTTADKAHNEILDNVTDQIEKLRDELHSDHILKE